MMAPQSLLTTRPRRKISLTALIDVVFILLMFFMLTSSFTQYAMVTLNTPTASEKNSSEKPQLLRLSTDSRVSIAGGIESEEASLTTAITLLNLTAPIVVLPHADANLQTILTAFETLKAGGAEQLSLGQAWGT